MKADSAHPLGRHAPEYILPTKDILSNIIIIEHIIHLFYLPDMRSTTSIFHFNNFYIPLHPLLYSTSTILYSTSPTFIVHFTHFYIPLHPLLYSTSPTSIFHFTQFYILMSDKRTKYFQTTESSLSSVKWAKSARFSTLNGNRLNFSVIELHILIASFRETSRLCPGTFVPNRHVCAHTRLCPGTFVPIHDCAHIHNNSNSGHNHRVAIF